MPSIVTFSGFGFAYPVIEPSSDPDWILQRIDLQVEAGEFVSIIGPTGAGKTTFCLALNGLVPQSTGGTIRGSVTVDGLDTRREPVPSLARRVGMVFQDPETQLFNMTVEAELAFGLENLAFEPAEIRERIEWAAATVGIGPLLARSPFHLSGGQKQRVAIASVLAMTPDVLVLDEPTTNLDPIGKSEVFAVVEELRRRHGMTIIMVEQDCERVAEFSDRVAVLANGCIELQGAPAEVFSRVEDLQTLGLAVPQVAELARFVNRRWSTRHRFTTVEDAERILSVSLGGSG